MSRNAFCKQKAVGVPYIGFQNTHTLRFKPRGGEAACKQTMALVGVLYMGTVNDNNVESMYCIFSWGCLRRSHDVPGRHNQVQRPQMMLKCLGPNPTWLLRPEQRCPITELQPALGVRAD